MGPGHVSLLVALPPLLVASALCSGAETALFSLSHADRVRLRRLSPEAADATGALLSRPRALLVTLLMLNNLVNVLYFVTASVHAARVGEDSRWWAAASAAGSLLALVLLGEILPKLVARRLRVEFCRLVSRPVLALSVAMSPVRQFVDRGLVAPLARLVAPRQAERAVTVDDLSRLLALSEREGTIEAEDHALLRDVIELSTIRVREIMTPRVDVRWLTLDMNEAEVIELIRSTRRLLLPVCRDEPGSEVLGWLDARAYLGARQEGGRAPPLPSHLRPVLYVPEGARLDQLLDLFRRSRHSAAVCVDEYGSVVGVVEIQDVVRQLVSEPEPEEALEDAGVERLGPGCWLVPGRMPIRELAEHLEPPGMKGSAGASTVGGLILLRLGRLPRVGDHVTLGNVTLEVHSMSGRTIRRVILRVQEPVSS